MKRKAKVTSNEVVWEWFTNARSKNVHISGPVVQSESLAVARSSGMISLRSLQHGWIEAQYCVDRVCGESKDVDESVVSEYKPKLLELISPYEPRNIYNAGETGLFF
jgi:hypothetical protein